MSLEQLLEKLIVSLDKNTAAHTASAAAATAAAKAPGKPPATVTPIKAGITPGPGEPTAPVVEFDAVKLAAGKVVAALGKPAAKKIIKDVGHAADLATVKPNRFYLLIEAFEKALTTAEAPEDDDDDDSL